MNGMNDMKLWVEFSLAVTTEGERDDRYLEIGKDDVMFADSSRKRKMARCKATLDIGSVLALFTDLSMINMKIELSILA